MRGWKWSRLAGARHGRGHGFWRQFHWFFTSFDALAAIGSLWHFDFMNERISIHPRICHGQACIRGTRIPVHQIVRMFAHGDGIETLLKSYSTITREDILACLDYAASLAEEQVTPLDEIGLAR